MSSRKTRLANTVVGIPCQVIRNTSAIVLARVRIARMLKIYKKSTATFSKDSSYPWKRTYIGNDRIIQAKSTRIYTQLFASACTRVWCVSAYQSVSVTMRFSQLQRLLCFQSCLNSLNFLTGVNFSSILQRAEWFPS